MLVSYDLLTDSNWRGERVMRIDYLVTCFRKNLTSEFAQVMAIDFGSIQVGEHINWLQEGLFTSDETTVTPQHHLAE